MAVSAADRRVVRQRAGSRCEYCRMAEAWEPFFTYHVEHIVARQHGGLDERGNLAFACNHCNLLKGPNLTSIDPDTGTTTPLYHPRTQQWGGAFPSGRRQNYRPYRDGTHDGFPPANECAASH